MSAETAEVFQDGWLGAESLYTPTFPQRHHTTAIVFEGALGSLKEIVRNHPVVENVQNCAVDLFNKVDEHKLPVAAGVVAVLGTAIGTAVFIHNKK